MIGFYVDRNSVYAMFKKMIGGRMVMLKYYPGLSPEGWNKDTRRFKDENLNQKIISIQKAIFDVTLKFDPFTLNNDSFAAHINVALSGVVKQETSFFEYCDRYFDYFAGTYTRRRAQTIRTCINKIKEFSPDLTFETIDKKFFREFMQHCADKGFATNYTGSIVRDLKRILNYATENEDNTNIAFKSFKKPMEEVFSIYLTEAEIQRIYDLEINEQTLIQAQERRKKQAVENKKEFTEKPYDWRQIRDKIAALDRARKLFVIGCWTGLRVENYIDIDPEIQIDLESGFIHAIANKNGPKLRIPIHKLVRQIAERDGFPEPVSEQKLNKHIKELGELAGITETVLFARTKGNRRVEYAIPKYKLIVSHTARRSFCSNLIQKGVPARFVMALSGHKTESSFNKYVSAVQKDIMTAKLADYDVWG